LGFSNPLPVPVGIEWESNSPAHFESAMGGKYMFVLEPETSTTLSPPRTWDIRPQLSIEATKLSAMYQRDNPKDLLIDRPSLDFKYVLTEKILFKYITSADPNTTYEIIEMDGVSVAKIPNAIVIDAQKRIEEIIQTHKTITYRDFSFKLVPLISCDYGAGDCEPTSTTPSNLIYTMYRQKYGSHSDDKEMFGKMLQLVHANISFRYL
jgi:hypothetical protein